MTFWGKQHPYWGVKFGLPLAEKLSRKHTDREIERDREREGGRGRERERE